jgi:hypothetical protein
MPLHDLNNRAKRPGLRHQRSSVPTEQKHSDSGVISPNFNMLTISDRGENRIGHTLPGEWQTPAA